MRTAEKIDPLILYIFIGLVLFGLVALSSASSDLAKMRFDDPYYYLFHQALYGLTLGVGGFLLGLFFPYEKYRKLAPIIFFMAVALLALTFTPLGVTSGGATRWLDIGPVTFQPAELLKIAAVIYLSAWLSGGKKNRQKDFAHGFLPFLIICGFLGGLLIMQKSTSSLIIILAASIAVYFASGAKFRYLVYFGGLGIIGLILLVLLTPYRFQRVATYLNPSIDTTGSGYQINQAMNIISSGGLLGKGYGNSVSKNYLPERIGDSIFAIIAEEFGFLGASLLILAFLFFVLRSYLLSSKVRDQFGRLLLIGFATVFGVQAFMNIGAISGLIPLTGVPLPFISYGGTALAVFMATVGIMLNIARRA